MSVTHQAEDHLLSFLVYHPDLSDTLQAVSLLKVEDFEDHTHRAIFQAVLDTHEKHGSHDMCTVLQQLEAAGEGTDPVLDLGLMDNGRVVEGTASRVTNRIPLLVKAVRESSTRRLLRRVGGDIQAGAVDMGQDPASLVGHSEALLRGVGVDPASPVPASEGLHELMDEILSPDLAPRVSFGLPDLDHYLGGGLVPGNLCYVAARPGVGKTSLASRVAWGAAVSGSRVLYVTLEMTPAEIRRNLVCSLGGTSSQAPDAASLSRGGLKLHQAQSLWFAGPKEGMNTTHAIRAYLHKTHMDLVVVDHIGLLKGGAGSRYEIVTELSHEMKRIALEFRCVLVVLSQLSRKDPANPTASHLRDSGALEEDADVVLMLKREAVHTLGDDPKAEIRVEKNRSGRTGVVKMFFFPETLTWACRDWKRS